MPKETMKKINKTWMAGMAALLVMCFWHLSEVQMSVQACGDRWLTGNYLALAVLVLGSGGLLGWHFLGGTKGREKGLEEIYPLAGLLLGLLYLFVLPPLSGPDEISHYISAYQLSSHMLGQPANSEDGHVLVRAQDWFLEDIYGDYEYELQDGYLRKKEQENQKEAVVLGRPLTEAVYRLIHEKFWERVSEEGQLPGEVLEKTAISPYPPVKTIPAAYIPQAMGVSLARILNLNSLWLVYLGRICNLLFFVAVTWLAMKRLPFGKEVLFGVAVLPMTLHLSASFSYDVWIMAWIFYFTSCCLHLAYAADQVKGKDVAILTLVMALVGPCKMVYGVFMGLCLLIPVRKFGGWRHWLLSACCVLGAWVLAMSVVNGQTVSAYVAPDTENYIVWAEETGYTLGTLLHQPYQTMRIFMNTLMWQAEQYHLTMIGAYLGNLDPVLDVPYVLVMGFTAGLLYLAFRKPGEAMVLTGGRRLWVWALCLSCTGAVMLSMLLGWTPLGSNVISGVQGRYFLPFLPVLFMSFKNDTLVLTRNGNRRVLYGMCCGAGYAALRIFGVVSMRL